eukprot:174216_1
MTDPSLSTYIICIALAIVLPSSTVRSDSALDNYVLFFDEWRFDWDDTNDFDTDYHDDWIDTISANDKYGCTHNLQTIDKKLCVLQSKDGDFTFRFKNTKDNTNTNYNSHSTMLSAAKQLSDYYDNILLQFDDDNYWSSIQSIDGVHGYEAIQKCQPFTFMELCAIYNPYADNLNVNVKLANYRKRRNVPPQEAEISYANSDYYNMNEEDYEQYDEAELSIEDAVSFAMQDYDDTLRYSYWRGNALGFDQFDERNPSQMSFKNDDNDALNTVFGGHTHYFNQVSFDWDDSRDWVSFSKQTTPAAKTEEVGAHPDKLVEEVGAHPKQPELVSTGPAKDTGAKTPASEGNVPSRSFTKCTGVIPFIHKHACVTVGKHDTHLELTSATQQEINILYNGLSDILNEIDIDQEDDMYEAPRSEMNDMYEAYDGGRRRLQAIYEDEQEETLDEYYSDLKLLSFDNDYDWDEVVHSYGFDQEKDNNYGRFGPKRATNDDHHESNHGVSDAVRLMIRNMNVRPLRPKLMHKTVPFLFPAIMKCVHTKIVKMCLSMDVHKKAVKLHVMMPRVAPMFKCIRNSMQCNPYRLQTGKRIFNGIKQGMGLIRSIGTHNPYQQTKKHLRKALKQVRKIRKHLRHLTRQIKKTLRSFSASDIDDNLYDDDRNEEDESMAQKVFDMNDEKGLLFYAEKGTNDFNDIWDDDNEWNAVEDMVAWDGRGIRRKCLTLWKKRLCLCQFLGWLDGPEKYHCLFPHHEEFHGYHGERDNDLYQNVQIKNVNPQIVVHHFHHIAATQEIENNMKQEADAVMPVTKPNWIPLWMWQDMRERAQNEEISKLLYSAQQEEYDADETYDNDEDYDNEEYYEQYKDALDEYYENSMLYEDVNVEDMINLNEVYEEQDEDIEDEEDEEYMKQNAWIEMSESATHDFDTEWDNDEHWDEISDIKTWEGTSIKRKCLHLWKHRLCLCQLLGWMDTNKYKCIYHHRTWTPATEQRYNTVVGHESDTKKEPTVILHDAGANGPIIHNFVPITRPVLRRPVIPHYVHHIYHYGPYHGRIRRPMKRKTIQFVPERPIHWQVNNPIIVHHFHHVSGPSQGGFGGIGTMPGGYGIHGIHRGGVHVPRGGTGYGIHGIHGGVHGMHGLLNSESGEERRRRPEEGEEEGQRVSHEEEGGSEEGGHRGSLKQRWSALKKREDKEHEREKKFKKLLWSDRHNHRMWKLMKEPHTPLLGNTVTGQHIIAEHINPHGHPLMVSMHKHMPQHRPQWMPQGLFTNIKHKAYYMVHSHKQGDHSTVTGDENRFVHGADIVSAQTQQYDVFDNYYYYADDELMDTDAYDDAYYYYDTQSSDVSDLLFDKYNDEKYEEDAFDRNKYMDEFVDDWSNEWVISDVVNAVENAFEDLFGHGEDSYWDSLEEIESKRGKMMSKKCLNIFDAVKCLCQYHGGSDHYHCHKKNGHRNRFYLDTLMPKETPPWMSAHDFDWIKDQRLSAFTEVLPDPLMKHIEYNELLSIPFNALSLLVHPAVQMEHMNWHKDAAGDASAHEMENNMYQMDMEEEGEGFSAGYVNEYGDYIIDEFYNEMDGTKWVVTNEWTKDLNDVWHNEDEMQVFSASSTPEKKKETGEGMNEAEAHTTSNKVETDTARTLSSKCMLVFGRNVCLCEFINWVYDHSGDNPLYRCYSSEISQATPNNKNVNTNVNRRGKGNRKSRAQVLNKLRNLEKTVMETGKKIDQLVSVQGGGATTETRPKEGEEAAVEEEENKMPKEKETKKKVKKKKLKEKIENHKEETSSRGWGSKIDNYGYNKDYVGYDRYETDNGYYDEDDSNYNEEDESVYDGYDTYYEGAEVETQEEKVNIKPNWWTDGDGFGQTVYIGWNTFWGLILLSIFFGMIAASVVCGYLQFKQLFCKDKTMSITCTPPLKMNIDIQRRDPFELDPINEDKL